MNELDKALRATLAKVTKNFTKEKKTVRRRGQLSASARERLYKPHYRELTLKDAAYRVMERAYMAASAGNSLPANARQIMYQARPLIQKLTSRPLWKKDSYFTQKLLPDFIDSHPNVTASWDVVYDARGHIEEPHTGKRVELGTLHVRHYTNNWSTDMPKLTLENITLGVETSGPANRFKFVLFIEKEGFDQILQRSRIQERFDIAIMSTKGMSNTSSRQLVEDLSEAGVTTLVVHDFDKWGLSICHTLHTDTQRYSFASEPKVQCLGMGLADVQALGLESETVDYKQFTRKYQMQQYGATAEEAAFLAGNGRRGNRVELNAMDSAQFIAWLEGKFADLGIKKVVPDKAILDAAYTRGLLVKQANEAIAKVQKRWNKNGHVESPADIEAQIFKLITSTDLSWDEAIGLVKAPEPKSAPNPKRPRHK